MSIATHNSVVSETRVSIIINCTGNRTDNNIQKIHKKTKPKIHKKAPVQNGKQIKSYTSTEEGYITNKVHY